MSNNGIEVSIVIPYYYGGDMLKGCLRMVFRQKCTFPFEVILIDFSGNSDGTLDFLSDYPVRHIRINPEEFNNGLTRNSGAENARGKYIVFMTVDATPASDHWLANIISGFIDESVAGVYCRQIPRVDANILTKRQLNNWVTGGKNRVINFIENRDAYESLSPGEKLRVCTFDDVCSSVRKSIWKEIPFDKTYIAEDLIWGKNVIEAGYKIVYEPSAAVIHSHDRSFIYEFKRTYLLHRKLFELFRLQNVPSLRKAIPLSINRITGDILYVFREEKNWIKKISLILKVPFLSLSSVFGQYMGARDEMRSRTLKGFGRDWR